MAHWGLALRHSALWADKQHPPTMDTTLWSWVSTVTTGGGRDKKVKFFVPSVYLYNFEVLAPPNRLYGMKEIPDGSVLEAIEFEVEGDTPSAVVTLYVAAP